MNKETLDALLIDRALGALSPDTEALLDAYLEHDPDTTIRMEQTLDSVNLARMALQDETPAPLPVFNAPRLVRRRRQIRYTLQAAGMAATLMIGLTLGINFPDTSGTVPPQLASVVPEAGSGIWAMAPNRLEKKTVRPARWKWHSPVQHPERINEGEL